MPCRPPAARSGLTLIELVVVVAILAVLAMIVVPKLDGLQNNANHAAAANSVSDLGRYIQTYRTTKQRFPDGWDSLTDGSALWQAANPGTNTKGLHSAFYTGGKFTGGTLTAADVAGLNAVGIYTVYNVTASLVAGKRPADVFTTPATMADGTPVAVVNGATSAGRNIIDRVYRDNQKPGGTSGAIPNGNKLIALGFGPLNKLVGTLMLEAPSYANVDSSLIYNRHLALFEVGGSKAIFKGVVAADGDLLDDLTTYINRDF
jgi:prepilin-type N-terminal cleavage/methylation domain-containing protein